MEFSLNINLAHIFTWIGIIGSMITLIVSYNKKIKANATEQVKIEGRIENLELKAINDNRDHQELKQMIHDLDIKTEKSNEKTANDAKVEREKFYNILNSLGKDLAGLTGELRGAGIVNGKMRKMEKM